MKEFIQAIWAFTVFLIALYGIQDVIKIIRSIGWLSREKHEASTYHENMFSDEDMPFVSVYLPVLREQRVIGNTLEFLTHLNYPLQRLRIFVITTEKEISQREDARKKLKALAREITSDRHSITGLVERYLGVFSEDVLKETIAIAQTKDDEQAVLAFLYKTFDTYPTTMDVVKKQIEVLNERLGSSLFVHIHYPHEEGGMIQQLHYARKHMHMYLSAQHILPTDMYIAVYNADSAPNLETLQVFAKMCRDHRRESGSYPPALQQAAIFMENINNLSSGLRSLLLQSAAIHSVRWVLSYDIPWRRRQCRSAIQFQEGSLSLFQRLTGAEYALCAGRGFFVRYDIAEELDLFSYNTMGNDILWSFYLCSKHIPIFTLPILESTENPTTITSMIKQKRSWFMSLTEYPKYRQVILPRKNLDITTANFVTLHSLIGTAQWLFISPIVFLAFILPLFLGSWPIIFITFGVYAIYGFLTYGIILAKLDLLRSTCDGRWSLPSRIRRVGILAFSLPVFLLHSVGPWWSIAQQIIWAVTRTAPYKEKTER